MPNMNKIDAVFQKLLSGHQILITHARTGVTLNAPPPFIEWRGHKNSYAHWKQNLIMSAQSTLNGNRWSGNQGSGV